MKNLIYKIKNKIFRFSKEAAKLNQPSYKELIEYNDFKKGLNNNLILSFGAGRCGQNWFAKIFNSHNIQILQIDSIEIENGLGITENVLNSNFIESVKSIYYNSYLYFNV